jgi:hypothetical protein
MGYGMGYGMGCDGDMVMLLWTQFFDMAIFLAHVKNLFEYFDTDKDGVVSFNVETMFMAAAMIHKA